ncbi:MAG: ester cyclase [Blastocatellia bacterium]
MSDRSVEEINEARVRVLDEHLRAENAHDVDRIMETFSQSAKFTLNGNTYGGHNLIRIAHERFGFSEGGSFSDLRISEQRRYTSDSAIILEQTVSGKHTGTWDGITATGREIKVSICTIYMFDADDRLVGENVYFDGALLLRQLGAIS